MDDTKQHTMEAAAAAIASKATQAGAGVSILGWLTSSEAGVFFGILLGVLGLAVNFWFKWREDKRQQIAHEAQMRAIRGDYP